MKKPPLIFVRVALLLLSAILLAASLCLFILPPQYGAVARISTQADPAAPAGPKVQQGSEGGFGGGPWAPTELERIQSKVVLFQVISNLDLNRKWGDKFKEGELQTGVTYALLKRQLEVKQTPKSSVIEIGVTSDDPTESASIANAIATVYLEHRKSRQGELGGRASMQSNPKDYLIISDSGPEIIDNAEADFHPVKPSRTAKVIVLVSALLSAVIGLGLLALSFRGLQPPAAKLPPTSNGS